MQERVIQAEVDMIEAINALRAEDLLLKRNIKPK
jgi:hypothetical protein